MDFLSCQNNKFFASSLGRLKRPLATNLSKIPRHKTRHLGQYDLLNMPNSLSIGWGIAYRYLLSPAVGGGELSIDTYLFNQYVGSEQ